MAGPNTPESRRFVLLWHDVEQMPNRKSHFDLLLEDQGSFVTIELCELPTLQTEVLGRTLPRHRLAYWDLQGPLSENRGHVTRVTRGEFAIMQTAPGTLDLWLCSTELSAMIQVRWQPDCVLQQLEPGLFLTFKATAWNSQF
jgi:hypothetical protein